MGRKRMIKLADLEPRRMWCDCGKPVNVVDSDVKSVKCCLCLIKMRPIPKSYTADIELIEKEIEEERQRKRLGIRGRPKKNTEEVEETNAPKRKRGRPRKNPVEQVEDKPKRPRGRPKKKESKMEKSVKKTEVKGKGKRGRKASVGAKVLSFINETKGNVMFKDILSIYSDERERLGKRGNSEIEKRNCLSTLYIMKRDGKIREVSPKTVYSAI